MDTTLVSPLTREGVPRQRGGPSPGQLCGMLVAGRSNIPRTSPQPTLQIGGLRIGIGRRVEPGGSLLHHAAGTTQSTSNPANPPTFHHNSAEHPWLKPPKPSPITPTPKAMNQLSANFLRKDPPSLLGSRLPPQETLPKAHLETSQCKTISRESWTSSGKGMRKKKVIILKNGDLLQSFSIHIDECGHRQHGMKSVKNRTADSATYKCQRHCGLRHRSRIICVHQEFQQFFPLHSPMFWCKVQYRNQVRQFHPDKEVPVKVWEALVQSQVNCNGVWRRFWTGLGGIGAEPGQVQQGSGSGEGLGGCGAEKVPQKFQEALVQSQVRFNWVPEKVPEKVPENVGKALVQSQTGQVQPGSGEGLLWCRARSGSTGFRRRYR